MGAAAAHSPDADGFATLPVSMPPMPSYPVAAVHHIYLRRNSPRVAGPDDSRSLFLANVPVDSTEAHFRALFTALLGAGRFESITLEKDRTTTTTTTNNNAGGTPPSAALEKKKRKRQDPSSSAASIDDSADAQLPPTWSRTLQRSGSTAVALLADEKSVDSALRAVRKIAKTKPSSSSSSSYPVWGQGVSSSSTAASSSAPAPLGSRWLAAHHRLSYPGEAAAQAAVDAYFALFNRREDDAARLAKRLRSEPDEDGFVTVTRGGGRAAPARRDEAEASRDRALEREARRRDGARDFYRFQLRERRKAEQADLLRRFAEDRKKVEAMKEKRGKFKPEV